MEQQSENNKSNPSFDDLTKGFLETISSFKDVALNLKNKLEEADNKRTQIGVEAVKILTEEIKKISEQIPPDTPEEAQKKMAEGMLLAALGASSLFSNIIKNGLGLSDLGITITVTKKEEWSQEVKLPDAPKEEPVHSHDGSLSCCDGHHDEDLAKVKCCSSQKKHGPLPCCNGHPNEDLGYIGTGSYHECNDDICTV